MTIIYRCKHGIEMYQTTCRCHETHYRDAECPEWHARLDAQEEQNTMIEIPKPATTVDVNVCITVEVDTMEAALNDVHRIMTLTNPNGNNITLPRSTYRIVSGTVRNVTHLDSQTGDGQ